MLKEQPCHVPKPRRPFVSGMARGVGQWHVSGRHIIWTFKRMCVVWIVFGRDFTEVHLKICPSTWVSILWIRSEALVCLQTHGRRRR